VIGLLEAKHEDICYGQAFIHLPASKVSAFLIANWHLMADFCLAPF